MTRTRGRWALNSRVWIGADHPAGPMLERWRLLQTPWFGIYVHFIYREDMDRVIHDHPWSFWSFILHGGYYEEFAEDVRYHLLTEARHIQHGQLRHFPLHAAHRITHVEPGTVSLVLVGRKKRLWGFYDHEGFVEWTEAHQIGLRANEGPAGNRPAGTAQAAP